MSPEQKDTLLEKLARVIDRLVLGAKWLFGAVIAATIFVYATTHDIGVLREEIADTMKWRSETDKTLAKLTAVVESQTKIIDRLQTRADAKQSKNEAKSGE